MQSRILIADDDPRLGALARSLLEATGYVIAHALTGADRVHPDAALVDVQLPDIDGLALARQLRETDGSLRIVLTSTDRILVSPARSPKAAPWRSSPKTSSR
jgi:DNA-binding response OmpR family regulator